MKESITRRSRGGTAPMPPRRDRASACLSREIRVRVGARVRAWVRGRVRVRLRI